VEDAAAEPAINFDVDDGEESIARATVVISLTHRTNASALTAWGS
jgi:hypothetical protein